MSSPERILNNATCEADEQKVLRYEMDKFMNRMRKFNQHAKFIRVDDVKLKINRPSDVIYSPWWVRMFNKK